MSLAGEHQLHNAATAITAVLALRDTGHLLTATTSSILKGLEQASLPGRFQVNLFSANVSSFDGTSATTQEMEAIRCRCLHVILIHTPLPPPLPLPLSPSLSLPLLLPSSSLPHFLSFAACVIIL